MALSRGEYPPTILFGSLALDSHNMGFGAAQGCLLLENVPTIPYEGLKVVRDGAASDEDVLYKYI